MLRSRLITALLLGAVFLGALFFLPDLWWGVFLLFFIVIGAWEWGGLVNYGRSGRLVFSAVMLIAGLLLLPGMPLPAPFNHDFYAALILIATLFWLLLAPPWLLQRWRLHGRWLAAVVGCVVLLSPWVALIQLRDISPYAVLVVMATVWIADSAAYFFGRRYGRRKLAPEISPGKTWEGLLGALMVVALFAAVLCVWQGWSPWFILGFLGIVVFSVMGDLFESLIKRQAGKKDSGALLPGHGGILDRIDALTSTLPLVTFYAYFPLYFSILVRA
jgi:phosphatidate cytidylyltransferase